MRTRLSRSLALVILASSLIGASLVLGRTCKAGEDQVVRLRATAAVGLSDGAWKHSPSTREGRLKLNGIQEVVLLRFDPSPVVGREVLEATLYLHQSAPSRFRYLRVSTVNQDWADPEDPSSGRPTFLLADADRARPRSWAWTGSSVADAIMSSGNSLGCWAERRDSDNGWISVVLSPAIVHALAVDDTDGLAVMEGGSPANESHYFSGARDRGFEPYVEARLGPELKTVPAAPVVTAEPAPDRAGPHGGAIRLSIEADRDVFCWRLKLDGRPVERWRVRHPETRATTVFHLDDLEPGREHRLEIVAVSPGGRISPPTRLMAASSPAQRSRLSLGPIREFAGAAASAPRDGALRVWAIPGLVKLAPGGAQRIGRDAEADPVAAAGAANAVWDGRQVRLFGARGEAVSFQVAIENSDAAPLKMIRFRSQPLFGRGEARIESEQIQLYRNWYAKNRRGLWQPAYCVPLKPGKPMSVPEDDRLPEQRNQTVYVDLHIPKSAAPGPYAGSLIVNAEEELEVELPIHLDVLPFALPDRLSFWPELNAYRIPAPAHDYYRLAHQHRCVLNCFGWRPKLTGAGRTLQVDWEQYDRFAGPLLSGEAFAECRRPGVPVECMYLPFDDSWPTPLTPDTYRYEGRWPQRGDPIQAVVDHYLAGPHPSAGLSQEYKDAFLAVQKQFIEHFEKKRYHQTEMQCFFGGKATHRVEHGANLWWTTDEPQHWNDWLALQFFLKLWTDGRGAADPRLWTARADISRPQWQGRTLNGSVDAVYYGAGGFTGPAMVRRCQTLARESGSNVRCYGSVNSDAGANAETVAALLNAWLDGADAYLPWQTLGTDKALDVNDAGAEGGAALLVPGGRAETSVLADLRLKALRDGQQLIEYLALLAERHRLSRVQIKAMLHESLRSGMRTDGDGASVSDDAPAAADSLPAREPVSLSPAQLSQLRRRVADLLAR